MGVGTSAVLLAERHPDSRQYLERHLRDDGFTVFEAGWTSRALDLAERLSPDVVIAGEADLCRRLRAGEPGRTWDRNVPVIVLTEPDADAVARVRALECGADDVVPRDVYLELLARVRALLRRAVLGQADVVEAGPLVVDHRARQVRVNGTAVRLSGREFELAAKLASDPTRVFTKAELLRDVWGIRTAGIRTRTVDSHASRLRRKLEAAGATDVVVNDWGVGYRLQV
jgi:DNA-binding response OmpR family regulator